MYTRYDDVIFKSVTNDPINTDEVVEDTLCDINETNNESDQAQGNSDINSEDNVNKSEDNQCNSDVNTMTILQQVANTPVIYWEVDPPEYHMENK